MTSRRSRLKAVANLPVRRKTSVSQGNADEATSVDNSMQQKAFSSVQKPGVITLSNARKNYEILEKEISENQCSVIVNYKSLDNVQVGHNCTDENINKTDESEIAGILDNAVNINVNKNLHSSKTESSNNSLISSKCFETNLISLSVGEKMQQEPLEKNQAKQNLNEQNCIISNNSSKLSTNISSNINNNNNNGDDNDDDDDDDDGDNGDVKSSSSHNNNNNNNIFRDGNKCYAILTNKSVALPPMSKYSITSLIPSDHTYVSRNIINEFSTQEYEEVSLCSNELLENEDDTTESRASGSVIVRISNSGLENESNNMQINIDSLESECVESNNENIKLDIRRKATDFKNNRTRNDDCDKNPSLRTKFTQHSVTSGSQVSTDIQNRQCISNIRRKRSKYNNYTKKLADAKREFHKKYEKTKPDRSTLKMIDLIFYNPATNPMESKNKFEKKDSLASASDVIHDLLEEERLDEPDALDQMLDNDEMENVNKMPVPQVKIGRDGEIILDEKSVVIETTDAKKGREELQNSVPVFEDRGCKVSYYRGKSRKSKDWTDFETKRFYKALNTIGPDFSLMQKYFPKRSRLELKNKFKREEKLNRNLIDKALNNPSEFDMTELEKDLAEEKEIEEEELEVRVCRIIKRGARKPRVKSSMLSREMLESDEEPENGIQKSSDLNCRRLSENDKKKKKKEFDFVLQKLLLKDSEKPQSEFREISSTSPNSFGDVQQDA